MAKKSLSMKVVVLLMAAVLLIGCSVGGTLAWLIANSETVTNTFVVGDINIALTETGTDNNGVNNNFKVLPGTIQAKDPKVIVEAGSEACWLFVQVQEVNNSTGNDADEGVATEYITYSVANGWNELTTYSNGISVYYKKINTVTEANTEHQILADNKVSYSEYITKADMDKLDATDGQEAKQPQLIFKAFAVQLEAATTAEEAWAEVDTGAKLS